MERIAHAVIMRDDKYLAVLGSKDWYWKLHGGGIKTGETPETALKRELKEEIGVTEILSMENIHEFPLTFKGRNFIFYNYLVNTSQNPTPTDVEEELELQWQSPIRMQDTKDQAPSQQILYKKLQELGLTQEAI